MKFLFFLNNLIQFFFKYICSYLYFNSNSNFGSTSFVWPIQFHTYELKRSQFFNSQPWHIDILTGPEWPKI